MREHDFPLHCNCGVKHESLAASAEGPLEVKPRQRGPVRKPPRPTCTRLGADTGTLVECAAGCKGGTQLKVFGCDLHGSCTLATKGKDIPACCKTCHDHTLADTKTLIVPQPPPLNLAPRSSRAIVTVSAGPTGQELLAITRPYMEAYAARLSADLVVLDWPGHPDWPMSSKFAIASALDHYERIAYVDADVLLRPGCIDLFAQCELHEMGVVNELPFHRKAPVHGLEAGYRGFRRAMGFPEPPGGFPWYFNAGVMVVPRCHRELLLPPSRAILIGHCGEQHHTNSRLLDSGLPYKLLDRKANWQWWTDHGFASAPPDAVLHFSGMRNDRTAAMRMLVQKNPLPTCDPWAIDARHRDWIRQELLTGQYRRVLEIGSYKGYSTQAFLDALAAGAVDEVHLCDINPTPELLALIEGKPGVTLHRCPSVNLLARDSSWDLVLVDGDHCEGVVTRETQLLIRGHVPTVFAHDTAAAGRYPNCEGPARLKAMLQAAGYEITEDAEFRPGERTDRGMTLAYHPGLNASRGMGRYYDGR